MSMPDRLVLLAFLVAPPAAWAAGGSPSNSPPPVDGASVPAEEPDPLEFRVFWKDGLNFQTVDKSVKLRIGGRIQNDWAWFSADGDLGDPGQGGFDFQDGTAIRRAYLTLEGEIPGGIEFRTQYDFAGGDVDFRDVYLGLRDTPVGNVRIGQFKEPLGLEQLTGNNYLTFLERSLPDTLVPARNVGLMLHDSIGAEQRATWAVGVFRDTNDAGNDTGDGDYALTGRLAGAPVYRDEGRTVVHLGAAASVRSPADGMVSINARPEIFLSPAILSTGTIPADDSTIYGLEAAWVGGPWSVQGEYVVNEVGADGISDPTLSGYYAFVSWFPTGENRVYRRSSSAFDKVAPRRPFRGEDGGLGAFELALRYSMLDFDDVPAGDDALSSVTLGLNWYLNTNTRMMFDYHMAELDEVDGDLQALNIRFQIFF